jgi:hypothetical protein
MARFDARNMSGSGFKYVKEHPFSVTIQAYIAETRVDGVLWQQFLWDGMVKNGMARFQFPQKLSYARFKCSCIATEELRCPSIDSRGPNSVSDSRDVDVMSKDELLYRFQDVGA